MSWEQGTDGAGGSVGGNGKARGGETEAVEAGNGETVNRETEAEETVERKTEDVEAADGLGN